MRASNPVDSTLAKMPGPATRLRRDELATVMGLAKWTNAELARRAGLDQSYIQRLREDQIQLGHRSIAGLLEAVWDHFGEDAVVTFLEMVGKDGRVRRVRVSVEAEDGSRAAGA